MPTVEPWPRRFGSFMAQASPVVHWINWWPGYPNNVPPWVPQTIGDSGSYSTGGGTVAPVPQAPPAVQAPKPDTPTEFATVPAAAEAYLSYVADKKPEQPDWYVARLLPQEKPVTVDWLEREVREANARRSTKLDLERLAIGLRDWGLARLDFQFEGAEKMEASG